MGYLNKVMEKTLEQSSKGLVQLRDRGIWQEIAEPNRILSEIEIPAQDRGNFQTIRNTIKNKLEVSISLVCFPSRAIMDTYEQKIHVQ